MSKIVFVSGCYDMLHSGHIAFFEEASRYGDLYVGIGSDKTIFELKQRRTIYPEDERLYMVQAIRYVKKAWINTGSGLLDFRPELEDIKPDIFFVNSDGDSPIKQKLCKDMGINYIVSKRLPHRGLPTRSTTSLRQECNIPYRLDLAGGWLDQPFVSKHCAGPVITISILPNHNFNGRSGMSTSSRQAAIEMWGNALPEGDKEKIAQMIFRYENKPGVEYISGSQDSIGIAYEGLNLLEYNGDYWPYHITTILNKDVLDFIEQNLYLVPLYPRLSEFDVLSNTHINQENAGKLSRAAYLCWEAIKKRDVSAWGAATTESFNAQIAMFPNMAPDDVIEVINGYKDRVLGYKMTGAGGGGYLILINDKPIENAIQIQIRRK